MCDICLIRCYDFGNYLQCYNCYNRQNCGKFTNIESVCLHCGLTHKKFIACPIEILLNGGIIFIGWSMCMWGIMKIRDILDLGNL